MAGGLGELRHADERLAGLHGHDVDERAGHARDSADQLRQLVRGVRVLHLGRRLPSERGGVGIRGGGGSEQREYPWGSTAPALSYAIYGCYYPDAGGNCVDSLLAPVGTAWLGAGLWGQLDLVGEVWEWDIDWYGGPGGPCVDCACLTGGSVRVLEGCTDSCPTEMLQPSATVDGSYSTVSAGEVGFRCARSP